jgi:hypothetical protein
MCMAYSATETARVKKLLKDSVNGKMTAYKVYSVEGQYNKDRVQTGYKLLAPYMYGKVTIGKDGTITSNRTSASVTAKEKKNGVEQGIHLYLKKSAAEESHGSRSDRVILEVEVDKDDFVAAGPYHAVFTKIRIKDKKQVLSLLEEKFPVDDFRGTEKADLVLDEIRDNDRLQRDLELNIQDAKNEIAYQQSIIKESLQELSEAKKEKKTLAVELIAAKKADKLAIAKSKKQEMKLF